MKKVYGYIRISTAKQGTGVSLKEQEEAIIRYAKKHDLSISHWFEEQETAAKQGRPLFTKMIKRLQARKVDGVIIHKIDRSARNLKDWAIVGDLLDKGLEVHFAHESLDMNTRGGRLAADIQAVIASDYIRNLRQEALKGLYGRLKQGIYPFEAPLGYLDNGRGKLKSIDPITGPLVKKAFALYASGKYSLRSLTRAMTKYGLLNRRAGELSVTTMSKILNNPFYMGIMRVKNQAFKGRHDVLISPDLYTQVQKVLKGKFSARTTKHNFLFRRLIKCSICHYSLIGEKQKGIIYYRCHTRECPTKTIRHDQIEKELVEVFKSIQLTSDEYNTVMELVDETEEARKEKQYEVMEALQLRQGQIEQTLDRLTDAYAENLMDKHLFERRTKRLLFDLQRVRHKIQNPSNDDRKSFVCHYLELLKSVAISYINGLHDDRRGIVEEVTSNLKVIGREISISIRSPFLELSKLLHPTAGDPERDGPRTCMAHFADVATCGDKYADCSKVREKMQELLDVIYDYYEKVQEQES